MAACSELAMFFSLRSCRVPCALSGLGGEWISCSCGRWLHEECAEDCVIDNNGKERLCSLCLEFFS